MLYFIQWLQDFLIRFFTTDEINDDFIRYDFNDEIKYK